MGWYKYKTPDVGLVSSAGSLGRGFAKLGKSLSDIDDERRARFVLDREHELKKEQFEQTQGLEEKKVKNQADQFSQTFGAGREDRKSDEEHRDRDFSLRVDEFKDGQNRFRRTHSLNSAYFGLAQDKAADDKEFNKARLAIQRDQVDNQKAYQDGSLNNNRLSLEFQKSQAIAKALEGGVEDFAKNNPWYKHGDTWFWKDNNRPVTEQDFMMYEKLSGQRWQEQDNKIKEQYGNIKVDPVNTDDLID